MSALLFIAWRVDDLLDVNVSLGVEDYTSKGTVRQRYILRTRESHGLNFVFL